MATIQVIQGADKGQAFTLVDGENIIGRQSDTIELNDGTVSRHHAHLRPQDGKWLIEDMGSANGTFLNGVRLTSSTPLARGDQIRCGSTLLVFGGQTGVKAPSAVDIDDEGNLVDAAIVATVPSNEDSVIIPTPEAGKEAIGNLRILYDLIAEVGALLDVDRLLSRTLDKIFDVLKADRGYVMLADANGKLELKASRISPDSQSQAIPVSKTIIREVLDKQVGVLSSNAMSDKRFAAGKSVHDFSIRSAICVPIMGRERILGVIAVDTSVSDQTYSTEQLRLLTAVGYQTGMAIENVRLHESKIQSERLAAVGETTAVLSHHIKNILQALSAGADVAESALEKGDLDKAKKSWPIVKRNLSRINTVILNMLAFSKDRQPLSENINVNHVIKEVADLVTPQADERGVAVMTALDDMPPIHADPNGLHQALLNLVNNALDAVPDTSGAVTITSRYDSMNRKVIITVGDNGKGISPEKLSHIFTPFFSEKGQGGTGLGLTVTKKIVREHRGNIDVTSTVGEGTTFTIALPTIDVGESSDTTHTSGK